MISDKTKENYFDAKLLNAVTALMRLGNLEGSRKDVS
jgi:hypothetical protein